MIALIAFPLLAASAVWLAGRRDSSRDPRLTAFTLVLLGLMPLLLLLPKIPLLPAEEAAVGTSSSEVFPVGIFLGLWLAGFLFSLTKLIFSAVGLSRWRKRSVPLEKIADDVELRQLPGIHGPVAAGIWRKVIFVPTEWSEWDEPTRRTVLLHELAHHRRHDPLLRWIAAFATAVHWFNPLVHWMTRRLALQCEHACDQRVIAEGVSPDRYAALLCRFASKRPLPVAGLAMAEMSSLESRVRHLMQPSPRRGFFTLALLGSLTLTAAAVLSLIGRHPATGKTVDREDIQLRLSANPFPADSP